MTHDTLSDLEGIISEKDVYEKYGHLFVDKELREARVTGTIEWLDLRKGVFYTREMLLNYLRLKVKPVCPVNAPLEAHEESENKPSFPKLMDNGSPRKKAARPSIVTGMTPSLAESAAALLERQT